MPSVEFGRIAAQTAKQVIVQKVREAEREQVVDEYKEHAGELVSGIVKRVDRNGAYVDLGGDAKLVRAEDLIRAKPIKPQDRIKSCCAKSAPGPAQPQYLTRTSPKFLIELFKIEVPEVGQGLIEILGAARDARNWCQDRSAQQRQPDQPISACVGVRSARSSCRTSSRASASTSSPTTRTPPQRGGDIVPAKSSRSWCSGGARSINLAVDEEKLSQAIGRGGQNIQLHKRANHREFNVDDGICSRGEVRQGSAVARRELHEGARRRRGRSRDSRAGRLFSLEEIAYVPASELNNIEEFTPEIVNELRSRARDVLIAGDRSRRGHRSRRSRRRIYWRSRAWTASSR